MNRLNNSIQFLAPTKNLLSTVYCISPLNVLYFNMDTTITHSRPLITSVFFLHLLDDVQVNGRIVRDFALFTNFNFRFQSSFSKFIFRMEIQKESLYVFRCWQFNWYWFVHFVRLKR